MYPNST